MKLIRRMGRVLTGILLSCALAAGVHVHAAEPVAVTLPAEETNAALPAAVHKLNGMTLSIVGDSISTFENYNPADYSIYYPHNGSQILNVADTWWMQVMANTGMTLAQNASYSGGTVTGDSASLDKGISSASFRRLGNLRAADGSEPGVIIIYMGVNDFLISTDLGAFSGLPSPRGDRYITDFTEAYELMIQKVKAFYPNALVYCTTLLETKGDHRHSETYPVTNQNGNTITDFNNRIKALAAAYAIPVIDLHECGITFDNLSSYTSDGRHPNVAGAKLMADYITAVL